jgi:hypothetical protein
MENIILTITLIIQSLSTVYYIWQVIIGKVVPQRIGWLIWTILGMMYLISGFELNAGLAIYFLAQQFLSPLSIFLVSLKYGKGGFQKLDAVCLVLSLIGIVLWKMTSQPLIGVFFACFSDSIGAFVIGKAAVDKPAQENLVPWCVTILSVVITLVISKDSSLISLISTVYIGLVNLSIILSILFGKYLLSKNILNLKIN